MRSPEESLEEASTKRKKVGAPLSNVTQFSLVIVYCRISHCRLSRKLTMGYDRSEDSPQIHGCRVCSTDDNRIRNHSFIFRKHCSCRHQQCTLLVIFHTLSSLSVMPFVPFQSLLSDEVDWLPSGRQEKESVSSFRNIYTVYGLLSMRHIKRWERQHVQTNESIITHVCV